MDTYDPVLYETGPEAMITPDPATMGLFIPIMLVQFAVMIVLTIILIIAKWKIFIKAGEKGWKSIVPIYNMYIFMRILNRPWWWLLLFYVPFVNLVIAIIFFIDLGKSFGKSTIWSVFLLFFLQPIGLMILGFGKSKYKTIERSEGGFKPIE